MTYRGHIKDGVAVLDDAVMLPDGTPVRVEVGLRDTEFSNEKGIRELMQEQGTRPFSDPNELKIDWPEDDLIDDLLTMIREVRR